MIRNSLRLLLFLITICCILYPLFLWTIGQFLFPFQANGSILLNQKGEAIGSKLIAQNFTSAGYFHPRPSAANYDASASAASCLAASNYALRDRVEKAISLIATPEHIPADRVTTSASGLDPHITLENAKSQSSRVAAYWNLQPAQILKLLEANAFAPGHGLLGEKILNVLELNLAIKELSSNKQVGR